MLGAAQGGASAATTRGFGRNEILSISDELCGKRQVMAAPRAGLSSSFLLPVGPAANSTPLSKLCHAALLSSI